MPIKTETGKEQAAQEAEGEGDNQAGLPGGALGFHRGGESPLAEKIPDADAEMEGGGENADGGEEKEIRIGEKLFYFGVGGFAVSEPALGVEMPGDVNEGDEAGVALRCVEPIPYPGIGGDVGLAAYPNIDAVAGVIEHREEDE